MYNKIIKKLLILLAALLLAAGGLAGCSGNNGVKLDPKNPVLITVWHYYNGAQKNAFDNAVKEFNETLGYEVGIIVESISHGGVNDLADNVAAAARKELDAGEMPNIFGTYGDTALEIYNMDKISAIDQYMTDKEIGEYYDNFIEEGRIGMDELYVFPIAKSTESLMLNKTAFDEFAAGLAAAGFTETVGYGDLATWEGIIRVADVYYRYTEKLDPAAGGKFLFGLDSLANYIFVGSRQLGQNLVEVTNGELKMNLDRQIMLRLWETYYEPMVTGRFGKMGKFCSDDIKTGDSLCFIGSTSSSSYFPTQSQSSGSADDIELIVLPMPVFEGGEKVAISQGAGMAVSKSTREKEYASVIFLKWFTETERNVEFSLGSSYLPVKKKSLGDDVLNPAFDLIDQGDTSKQNAIKSLRVGVEQLRDYTMYISDVFDGSADFRNTMPVGLENAVTEDRAEYLALIAEGLTPQQAYAALGESSLAKFEGWLNSLK